MIMIRRELLALAYQKQNKKNLSLNWVIIVIPTIYIASLIPPFVMADPTVDPFFNLG